MNALEKTIADLGAALAALDPAVTGAWRVMAACPGTYGYDSVLIEDGRKVASCIEKWPEGAVEYIVAASPPNVVALLDEILRLRLRVDGLLGAMNREVERRRDLARELETLRAAGTDLYMAGRWSCDRLADEVRLWIALRDALGLEPGTATAAGMGADPAEPPLPFAEPVA